MKTLNKELVENEEEQYWIEYMKVTSIIKEDGIYNLSKNKG